MIRLLLFSLFSATVSAFNWTQPDLGRDCGPGESGSPGIKYYHDRETLESLPFFYRGCGGDSNRYDDPPVVMDYSPCPGYPVSVGDCHRGDDFGPFPSGWFSDTPAPPKECPPTAYCSIISPWGGEGECCDSAVAARAAQNQEAPLCKAAGVPAIKEKTWYGEKTYLGRNCSHNFCPEGSICHQGEFYAYCCQKLTKSFTWTQPDAGRACQPGENGEAPGIRYYVDRDANQAFPFYYLGCGGDNNYRFESRNRAPLLLDYAPCPGYPAPIGDGCSTGYFPGSQPKSCPANAYCRPSNPWNSAGKCCDSAAAEREALNRQGPECRAAGLSVVMEERSWGPVHFLGRSCSHNFCPQGSTCKQGEFYAYCCK